MKNLTLSLGDILKDFTVNNMNIKMKCKFFFC